MKNKKFCISAILAYMIVFTANIAYMCINWANIINSDASSELILARLLNSQGKFISEDWFYSTELRVLNTQFVYKIALFLFGDNWKYARCFSMAIFMLLIMGAAIYISKQLCQIDLGLMAAVIMIFPIGKWYANNIIFF